MYVKNHMLPKDKLTLVYIDESIGSALEKINKGDFLSLPVFDGDEFKGILMKEAIFRYYFETNSMDKTDFLDDVKVKDLYNEVYKSILETEIIENASYLLKEVRTPFLPVFDVKGNFTGILTHTSIFNAFSEIFGLGKGTRILVNLFDIPGQLAKLTGIIRKENVNIINIAVMDAKVLDVYKVVIRVDTEDVNDLINKIDKSGFKVAGVSK
ncbi:CBS domain-containing protein [Anaerosalibacter bizertensis]|uniref:CBS domain-containing protein n=1 Tax=Anaerosalibacter bizertensis TaxID=932217 RepID=A0A844FJV1_9FIRM|nr:CBS domain-containing protein [Anaerosalibacter bizertensis]MSS44135.1 CBS domain-containing protein [Anaerosalibacter bizertensis]HHV27778.1 CBS domain-containing protein [Tissierellia bacterium]